MRSVREPRGFRAADFHRLISPLWRGEELTAETAKAYVARLMASYKDSVRVEINHEVASTEGGSALKITGRAFYSDGSATAFE